MAHTIEKRQAAEQIWLHYFNQELHKRSLISTADYSKIMLKIERRTPPTNKMLHTTLAKF